MNRLGRFLRLPAADRALLVRALIVLAAVRLGLWYLPFPLLRRLLALDGRRPRAVEPSRGPSPQRIAWAVGVASRCVPRSSCLVRALGARLLLQRVGHPSRLRLGVARDEAGRFTAHAWLEHDRGILVGAAQAARVTALPAFGGGDR